MDRINMTLQIFNRYKILEALVTLYTKFFTFGGILPMMPKDFADQMPSVDMLFQIFQIPEENVANFAPHVTSFFLTIFPIVPLNPPHFKEINRKFVVGLRKHK